MTIAVGILGAVLGIIIGALVMHLKAVNQVSEAKSADAELAKNAAVLQSQLDAAEKALDNAKVEAAQQIASIKDESARQLETTKSDYEKILASAKQEAVQNLADERARASRVLAEEKEAAAKRLAEANEAAEKRLESMKQNMEQVHQKSLEEQKERFDDISKKLVAEAKNATEEMVKLREKQITESGHATMEQLVNPLKETIDKMEKTMNDTTKDQAANNASLKEVLKQSIESNATTKQTADELIRAFRHESKIQGDWGERVLEEVLESLDLKEGIHFEMQSTLRDANGNTLCSEETGSKMRPDVIVHLDKTKDVIIDSKVSMKDFMDYASAEDCEQRKEFLKKHIESLKKHVKELSVKNYSSYIKAPRESMDFVIMFVPNYAALWTALKEEPKLWRDAMEKNVFIADEQTLYAALRMVKLTWQQIQQAENQQKVFELANEMLKRVGMFVKQMDIIGTSLDKAQEAYKRGMSKFSEGGQSVLTTCRQLQKLGAKQDTKNPLPVEQEAVESLEVEGEPVP